MVSQHPNLFLENKLGICFRSCHTWIIWLINTKVQAEGWKIINYHLYPHSCLRKYGILVNVSFLFLCVLNKKGAKNLENFLCLSDDSQMYLCNTAWLHPTGCWDGLLSCRKPALSTPRHLHGTSVCRLPQQQTRQEQDPGWTCYLCDSTGQQ